MQFQDCLEGGIPMVDISVETSAEVEARIRRVLKQAELEVFDRPYCFREFALADFPAAVASDALALVRDQQTWSQLVPYDEGGADESFALFSFHFKAGLDNSGFVGWLASHFKKKFGTGVFVICGYSAERGGIYDYWGCPALLVDKISEELRSLAQPEAD
jgi:hypothetical protein